MRPIFCAAVYSILLLAPGLGARLSSAENDSTVTLRVSNYLSPFNHSVQHVFVPWIEQLSEASEGRIKFETYWGGGLGRSPYKQFDLVKAGIADIALVQPSYTAGQFPQMQAFQLPFLMRSSTEASLVAWRLFERGMLDGFQDVKLLGLWTAEPGNLYTRVPIKRYKDIETLKIRSVGRLEGDFLKRLNAVPESMHPADAVEALRRDTIDGAIHGWIAVDTFKTYRETSHVITASLGTVPFAMIMNKEKWDEVPRDLQKIINDNSGPVIAGYGGHSYDRRQTEISARLKEEEHYIFVDVDPAELAELNGYVNSIAEEWMARTPGGREAYETLQEILVDLRSGDGQP